MRLPAVTKEHQQNENSRQWHERLWAAHESHELVYVPVTPETAHAVQLRISSNTRTFWSARGYRIRTETSEDRRRLAVWLERMPMPIGRGRRQVEAWQQPRA